MGGGLAGALMATYLGRQGYEVDVYEKLPDLRNTEHVRGRSINLAISTRGLHALGEVGLKERVLEMAVPMRGRMMHSTQGKLTFQPYGKNENEVINSVSRGELNKILLTEASQHAGVRLFFNESCVDVDLESGRVEFENVQTKARTTVESEILLGADGAFSVLRGRMQKLDRFDYQQNYLTHGYKELNIPPAEDGGYRMENNALHIWPRRSFMMIALPNADGSFTCTLFWPFEGENSFSAVHSGDEVEPFFRRWFGDAVPHMPTLVEDYLAAPPSSLVTVRCWPWSHQGRVALLGDACHAVVPFYGQGMNAAFEDCSVLNECIQRHAPDWEKIFTTYQALRKENVDALADLAINNFIEMRDRVASMGFLLRKKLSTLLHKLAPRWYIPLYSLITFSRTPYAEARRRARRQVRWFQFAGAGLTITLLILLARWLWR